MRPAPTMAAVASATILLTGCTELLGLEDLRAREVGGGAGSEASGGGVSASSSSGAGGFGGEASRDGGTACDPQGCLGGDCIDGKCQPMVVASGLEYPHRLAVTSKHVFWTKFAGEQAELYRLALEGPALSTKIDSSTAFSGELPVAASPDGATVCWSAAGTIRCSANAGTGDVTWKTAPAGTVWKIVITAAGQIVWTDSDGPGGGIRRAASFSAFPNPDANVALENPLGFDLSGNEAYVVDFGSPAPTVEEIELMSAAGLLQHVGFMTPKDVARLGDQLFVTDYELGLMTMPLATRANATLVVDSEPAGYCIVSDGQAVYWTKEAPDGGVFRYKAGEVHALATGQQFALGIAVDESFVWWVTRTTPGAIMRVAKPTR